MQQIETLAAKPDNLSLIPETLMLEGKLTSTCCPLTFMAFVCARAHVCTNTHVINKQIIDKI